MIKGMPRFASIAAALVCLAAGCSARSLKNDASQADGSGEVVVPPLDTAVDSPSTCGGTVDLRGTTPEGAFSGSVVATEIASNLPPHCRPAIRFRITDGGAGSSFEFELPADAGDGGAFQAGARSIEVFFFGVTPRPDNPRLTQTWTTSGTVEVVTADPLPFATCEQAKGDPIALTVTDAITVMIGLTQDGFSITGRVSAQYCRCKTCPDSV